MAATDPESEAGPAIVATENNTTPQNVTIAEEGDVILVLDDGKKRIRVSAALLSFKSSVFRKMLGPHFLEGQTQRSTEQPQEIQLPEDDPHVMGFLCRLLHNGRPDSAKYSLDRLANMAVLADKYDCIHSVNLIAETLLRRWAAAGGISYGKHKSPTWAKFAATALLLRLDDIYVQVTRCVVLDVFTPYSVPLSDCSQLPTTVLLGLEEQRTAVRNLLVNTLATRTTGGTCRMNVCYESPTGSTFERDIARRLGLKHWPPNWDLQPAREIFDKLASQPDIWVDHTYKCSHSNLAVVLTHAGLQDLVRDVDSRAYGICPHCARQDKLQSSCEHVETLKKIPHGDSLRQLEGTTT
ncbi:hypothetical protein LTR56_018909 [Elasticomyces elasticus]|nr:hypothetical protein LTR56_018909 [Elasticomyces elasticus]